MSIAPILIKWPVIDLAVAASWYFLMSQAWKDAPAPIKDECIKERQLGATVILAQLNGVIMASSIILVGIGGFVAFADTPFVRAHLVIAALLAILALILALFTMGWIPTYIIRFNVIRLKRISTAASMAFLLSVIAGARFMLGIFNLSN